ncbi:MAG TPA: hypothetical protein VFG01_04965 [Acidobacteriota bacterium]|nr:hypothetical protein [Acidobacteriota bacterium]
MDWYVYFKGGDGYRRSIRKTIRKKGGVNFTPELWVTFSQFNLGKEEERIA